MDEFQYHVYKGQAEAITTKKDAAALAYKIWMQMPENIAPARHGYVYLLTAPLIEKFDLTIPNYMEFHLHRIKKACNL